MKVTGERIHTQLAGMVNGSARTYLQDAVITMRNGRYCIPVKAEYKSQVPGMIHDQSSTGSTLFIEPMAIVKLNNEIRDLEMKEAAEIEVILASLSNMAAQERENLRYNLENLVELDFIFARAALAMDMNATRPIFNTKGYINIRKGRHPLIDKKKGCSDRYPSWKRISSAHRYRSEYRWKNCFLKNRRASDSDGSGRSSYSCTGSF